MQELIQESRMQKLTFTIAVVTLLTAGAVTLQAQEFDLETVFNDALALFESGDYQQAILAFESIEGSDEARLMASKSYYAMGDYTNALASAQQVSSIHFEELNDEAKFIAALSLFRLREFKDSLLKFYELQSNAITPEIQSTSNLRFNEINQLLTHPQRLDIIQEINDNEALLTELFNEGMSRSDRTYGQQYINLALENRMPNTFVSEMRRSLTQIPFLQEPITPTMPDGMIYNLGVILPQQERGEIGYDVSRQLYYGFLLAIEEQNSDNRNRYLSVHVASKRDYAYEDEVSATGLFKDLVESNQIDIVFGPLFSEDAKEVAGLATQYEIPVISPLANSDDLAGISPYFYQANPTFSMRGRVIADFAVNQLEYDSLAVLVERNTAGISEANAFRQLVQEHGAHITHFFNLDFQLLRFDVTNQIENFALNNEVLDDTTRVLQPVDGLFLPLTGEAAPTMIDNILTNLIALQSPVTVLGTEEWGLNEINTDAVSNLNIVYTAIFNRSESDERVINFRSDYLNRYGREPSNFAFIGYDIGHFMAEAISQGVNPSLINETIQSMDLFRGINQHLHFDGEQINQGLQLIHVTLDGPKPAEDSIELLRKIHYVPEEELLEEEEDMEFEEG